MLIYNSVIIMAIVLLHCTIHAHQLLTCLTVIATSTAHCVLCKVELSLFLLVMECSCWISVQLTEQCHDHEIFCYACDFHNRIDKEMSYTLDSKLPLVHLHHTHHTSFLLHLSLYVLVSVHPPILLMKKLLGRSFTPPAAGTVASFLHSGQMILFYTCIFFRHCSQ